MSQTFSCRVKILLQAQSKHYKQLGVGASLKKVDWVKMEVETNSVKIYQVFEPWDGMGWDAMSPFIYKTDSTSFYQNNQVLIRW